MQPASRQFLAGLVLAAGGSARLGVPKQLLKWRGKSLIANAVEQSLAVCGAGVIVVTGADATSVVASLRDYPVEIVHNADWQTGAAGSLSAGIDTLRSKTVQALLVTLCDQPLVTAQDLARLAAAWERRPHIPAAARYSNIIGVPAIFPASCFASLAALQGDTGARSLLRGVDKCTAIDIPSAALDIDTAEDMAQLGGYDQ
jgi:molybdenum cofactor cytidylyltransferase